MEFVKDDHFSVMVRQGDQSMSETFEEFLGDQEIGCMGLTTY